MKNICVLLIAGLLLIGLLFPSQYYAQSPSSSSKIVFTATLNAANETGTDTSNAAATAWAVLSSDRKHLAYRVTYANLTSDFTAAHFHLGAKGVNGPVIQAITYTGNTAAGSWDNLPDSIVAHLLKGNIYINVHSQNYPAGEIRGQLMPANGIPFTFSLDASQVTSTDTSKGAGTGWGILTNVNSSPTLTYGVTVGGLTSAYSASHFHIGAVGQNGNVVQAVPLTNSSAFGSWSGITDANLLALIKNGLYFNVHTANYPGGEIRGQVNETGPISFSASINGSQEVPSVTSNASGTGWFVLKEDLSSLGFRITYANLSSAFTASHFHLGATGVSGSVVHPITYSGNTATGVWTSIPDTLLLALIKENLYVNVHSTAHAAGEIRGQVLINKGVAFSASLNGSQDVPSILTTGSGTAWASLVNDSLSYRVTIAGLSSVLSASHFHSAAVGVNGSVVNPITFTDSLASSVWANLSNDNLVALVNNGLYINVHTAVHPAGEIRGQVLSSNYTDLSTAVTSRLSWTFENNSIGDSLAHIGWTQADVKVLVAQDPKNVARKVLQNTIHNYNGAPYLQYILPAGKTLADYDSFTFKGYFAQGDVGYKDIVVEAYQKKPTAQFANNTSAKIGSWNRAQMGSTNWENITVNTTNSLALKDTIFIAFGINCAGIGDVGGTGVATIWYADSITIVQKTPTDVKNITSSIPSHYELEQNYPNPFNPSTFISYQLPVAGHVSLKVYNLIGQEVATLVDEFQNAGNYKIQFNMQQSSGRGQFSSGIYFYRLSANNFSQTRKMVLLK